jgi:hypothetical protein
LPARANHSDRWPTPSSWLKLIAYIDHLAEGARDPKIWLKIAASLDAAMAACLLRSERKMNLAA